MPSAQSRASNAPKCGGVQGFDIRCAEVWQFDVANTTFHPLKTKTELAGDFPDGVATFEKRPDLIEQFLPNGKRPRASSASG